MEERAQMNQRNVVRSGLILATLGVEALLAVWALAIGWSGTEEDLALSRAMMGLMLFLLVGCVACLANSPRSAAVIGFVLLALGVGAVFALGHAYEGDVNAGTITLSLLLPAAIVLGGAWLTGTTRDRV
jgi:peptidoglycan/LPS O-acetylase OafA/YrhL